MEIIDSRCSRVQKEEHTVQQQRAAQRSPAKSGVHTNSQRARIEYILWPAQLGVEVANGWGAIQCLGHGVSVQNYKI